MQSRFDAQTYNCNTLSAIDKLGDRIVAKLDYTENQRIRDENQYLKFAASQRELVDTLRPCPVPAYQSCNPWAASYGFNTCGCTGYGA